MKYYGKCAEIARKILEPYLGETMDVDDMLYCMADIAKQCYQQGVKDGKEEQEKKENENEYKAG